jgi:hypothetical protein
MTSEAVLRPYGDAWNTDDEDERRKLLEAAWADDGEYVDPTGHFDGRDAIMQLISDVRSQLGNIQVLATTGFDVHHDWARFGWRFVAEDGTTLFDGIDAVQFGEDGRIKRMVGFVGPFPEL